MNPVQNTCSMVKINNTFFYFSLDIQSGSTDYKKGLLTKCFFRNKAFDYLNVSKKMFRILILQRDMYQRAVAQLVQVPAKFKLR